MTTPTMSPETELRLRKVFRVLNRFMIFLWKAGFGGFLNSWPAVGGRIMLIQHTGRKSGKVRYAPVNYAEVDGEIYCLAGFGSVSDWYRNLMANPEVLLWLPRGKFPGVAHDISDSPDRLRLLRAVLVASGFAAPLFGINPRKLDDEQLAAISASYRMLHIQRE